MIPTERQPSDAIIPTGYAQPVAETLPGVVARIVRALQPDLVVLFGSYARGEPTPDSDVDLFVVRNTDKTSIYRGLEITRAIEQHPFAMDVVVRTPDEVRRAFERNEYFVPHILAEGRVLYNAGMQWPEQKEHVKMALPPDIAEWLEIAEGDLRVARSCLRYKPPITRSTTFHAQQCIEKYLKAVLIASGKTVIKTHDLNVLYDACVAAGATLALNTAELDNLSKYAVETRYPSGEPTLEQAREALRVANKARKVLRKTLGL